MFESLTSEWLTSKPKSYETMAMQFLCFPLNVGFEMFFFFVSCHEMNNVHDICYSIREFSILTVNVDEFEQHDAITWIM